LVEQERSHLIVPEFEAIAIDELMRIESDRLARAIPTTNAAHIKMNRECIRRLALEQLGLPTSPFAFASSLEELQAGVDCAGCPCVVKPKMSSSGER
jgi:phosphoribosylglycinamide formyltransferase 2